MRIVVDESLCAMHGDCVVEAPELFDLGDDDDVAVVLQPSPDASMRPLAERAAAACPVRAIRIDD